MDAIKILSENQEWNLVNEEISYLEAKYISQIYNQDIVHGFCTRNYGFSSGFYKSLNCSINSKDDSNHIENNINKVSNFFDKKLKNSFSSKIKLVNQTHSNSVIEITSYDAKTESLQADAIITSLPGIMLAVQTADCLPIFLYDQKNKIIAAIHAGWKGAFTGVIENTIKIIKNSNTNLDSVIAILGPSIAMHHYQVDEEFYNKFINENKKNAEFFSSMQSGHCYFNLRSFCIKKLINIGILIKNTYSIPLDTYANEELFFSCRRSKQESKVYMRDQVTFGGQISCIGLKKTI